MSFLRRTEEGGEDDGEELAYIVGDEGKEIVAVEVEERPLRHLHAFATNNLPSETTPTTTTTTTRKDQPVNDQQA